MFSLQVLFSSNNGKVYLAYFRSHKAHQKKLSEIYESQKGIQNLRKQIKSHILLSKRTTNNKIKVHDF